VALAPNDFWTYCKLLGPEFYKQERKYLENYCNLLQAFHENRIIRPLYENDYHKYLLDPIGENKWIILKEGERVQYEFDICVDLSISMPPRMGKSRTLVMFESWILGKNNGMKFITGSYNDGAAADFSRYVRDTISSVKAEPIDVNFHEIFPETSLDRSNKSVEKWALDGQHFNYLGAGAGGSVTGKGCNYLIVDDPVKSAEDAFNETYMKRIWTWISSTLPSRLETDSGKTILNFTRWPGGDPKDRVLDSKVAGVWFHYDMPACIDEETREMLCAELLSYKRWCYLRDLMNPEVFYANYQQLILSSIGALYKSFRTYERLPMDENGKPIHDMKMLYCDTADQGDDHLCAIFGDVVGDSGYVRDVYFTQDPVEITEDEVVQRIIDNKTYYCIIESNNGGRAFALNIERKLYEKKYFKCVVDWFHQSDNKRSRLLTNATNVAKFLYFPEDWNILWPEYHKVMTAFQRKWLISDKTARAKHDDGPDGTTGFYEKMDSNSGVFL